MIIMWCHVLYYQFSLIHRSFRTVIMFLCPYWEHQHLTLTFRYLVFFYGLRLTHSATGGLKTETVLWLPPLSGNRRWASVSFLWCISPLKTVWLMRTTQSFCCCLRHLKTCFLVWPHKALKYIYMQDVDEVGKFIY